MSAITIKSKALGLLTTLESGQTILTKSADDKKILEAGGQSLYDKILSENSITSRSSLTAQQAVSLIPENSDSNPTEWDHPITDRFRIQEGFDGSEKEISTVEVAASKAVLAAESSSVTEGVIYHAQLHSEFKSTSGIDDVALNDPLVSKETRGSFAKKNKKGGYDKDTTTNTKSVNASGICFTAPYDSFDPADPDLLNQLSLVAGGLAYAAARESIYAEAGLMTESQKRQIYFVTMRNANAAILDRNASDSFCARMNLDLSKKRDLIIHKTLMDTFRVSRNQIGGGANNVLNMTLTLGLVLAKYSYAHNMIWTNEKKLGRIKTLVDENNSTFYMAASYDQAGCSTVPVDLKKLSPTLKSDICTFVSLAIPALNNEACQILDLKKAAIDNTKLKNLSRYTNEVIPTVAEALGLPETSTADLKAQLSEQAKDLVDTVLKDYDSSTTLKAMAKFAESDLN